LTDPFFKAIGGAIAVMVIFFVSVLCGGLLAAKTVKGKNARQAVTVLFALVIFLLLFFLSDVNGVSKLTTPKSVY
jgi:hypothetical protein